MPLTRRTPARTTEPPRAPAQHLPLEEISSSLLLPDDPASGALPGAEDPGLEELSGSLLLDDPSLMLDDLTQVNPVALEAPAAAVPPVGEAAPVAAAADWRPPAHVATLGLPELPTSTPAPNLGGLSHKTVPSSGTLRPPDTTPQALHNPSSSSMSAALPADGVPPPPEQMFEALHGFEAAQADATAPHEAAPPEPPVAAPPPTTTEPAPGDVEMTSLPRGSLAAATDAMKRVLDTLKSALGDESGGQRRRWFLPAIALAGLVVGVAVVALIVSLARKGADESEARTDPSAVAPPPSAPEKASATEAPQPAPVASVAPPSPLVESPASTAPCKVTGKPRVVAPSAIVSAGVEVRTVGNDVALGFAPNEHQATAVRIDPSSLSLSSTVDAQSADTVRRVVPLASADGALSIAADADRDGDVLQGRRTVPLDPPLDIGAAGGKLVWAHPGGPSAGVLWPLDGTGNVEALRGATDLGSAISPAASAIAMRFGGAIWMGTATGHDGLTPQGALSRATGLGDSVGSPAIAINDGVVIVAWADRASAQDPWGLRWVRFKAGEPAGDPGTFTPPAGGKGEQVMSPGLAAVPGGRFLLVWTDGPAARHDVRALTLSRDGVPLGKPLNISNRSANAGQGQAAINAARQGLVAFLESAEGGFRVVATAITCGP
jgi:hypothetical protein